MRILVAIAFLILSFSGRTDTKMDASFMFGPSIAQSGNIQELGDPNFNTMFEFNYYFKDKHGMGFSIGSEYDFDGEDSLKVLNDVSLHIFELHYSFRHHFENSKFKLTFNPGFGWQTIYNQYQDYYWGYTYYDDLSTAWLMNYKLFLDYMVSEGERSNFFLGLGIVHIFTFNDEIYGKDISGSRLSGLFRIGFGF